MKTNNVLSKQAREFVTDLLFHMGCDQSGLDRINYKLNHTGNGVIDVIQVKTKKKFKITVLEEK